MVTKFRNSFLRSRRRALRALGLAAIWSAAAPAQEPSADEDPTARSIVEKADEIRFPAEGFEVDVDVTNVIDSQVSDRRKYKILSKGNENTIVQVVEPAADRGQVMLMRGRDLWVFLPNISQPVRLSLSQRLTGQVANGDLARANFAGDYRPRMLRMEKLDGIDCHVLELVAVDRGVTYARVLYWVRQANAHPVKAEFYSVSERLLKTCRYENFKNIGGRVRPTRLVLQDALKKGEESILDYSDLKLRDLPDRMFTKEYLRRL
jgi:outer membrane lipoprotein-sorting protein